MRFLAHPAHPHGQSAHTTTITQKTHRIVPAVVIVDRTEAAGEGGAVGFPPLLMPAPMPAPEPEPGPPIAAAARAGAGGVGACSLCVVCLLSVAAVRRLCTAKRQPTAG